MSNGYPTHTAPPADSLFAQPTLRETLRHPARSSDPSTYRRCITYILDTEHGTTLNAAGWRCIGKAGGGSWSVPSRPRLDKHPLQGKFRFEVVGK